MKNQWILGALSALTLVACATTGSNGVPVYGNYGDSQRAQAPSGENVGAVELASANDPEGEHVQPGDRNR